MRCTAAAIAAFPAYKAWATGGAPTVSAVSDLFEHKQPVDPATIADTALRHRRDFQKD